MGLINWTTATIFLVNFLIFGQGRMTSNSTSSDFKQCAIQPNSGMKYFFRDIVTMQKEGVKVIEILIHFENYSTDPLSEGNQIAYDMHYFGRANTPQGMRLLDLSFHYDITQLARWSMGIRSVQLEVHDDPEMCTSMLSEVDKMSKLINLLSPKDGYKFYRLCHKTVTPDDTGLYASYGHTCCWYVDKGKQLICGNETRNKWLVLFTKILLCVRVLVLLFGPLLISNNLQNQDFYHVNYYVKPSKIQKMMVSYKKKIPNDEKGKGVLKLPEKTKTFNALKCTLAKMTDKNCLVQISRYKLSVNHGALLTETHVPVSLWTRVYHNLVSYRYGMDEESLSKVRWYSKLIGQILLVILAGVPYYIRIGIFYHVELPKVELRWEIAKAKDLLVPYDWNLMSYLTPLHWVWIILYINYIVTITIIICSEYCKFALGSEIRRVAHNAAVGLFYINYFRGFDTFGNFLIWPMKHFGCMFLIFALFWFAFAIPFIMLMLVIYLVPLSYLSARIIVGSAIWRKADQSPEADISLTTQKSTFREQLLKILDLFRIIHLSGDCSVNQAGQYSCIREGLLGVVYNIMARIMVFSALLAVILIFSECVGFLVDLSVLILIGIIANAETLLKYVTIVVLIVFYIWDINRDINDAYLKLTAAIFAILQGEVDELQSVMDLPSHIQQNTAFIYDTGHTEQQSKLSKDGKTLCINKLALYVDNKDTPRIPRELFESMAKIEIVGTPGPIYKSYIKAFVQLFCILVFLSFMFLIILLLGEEHEESSGGSSLFATVVGGCLPLVIKVAFTPKAEDLQLESQTFKAKLNEAVALLQQQWPLVDLEIERCDTESGESEGEATQNCEVLIVDNVESNQTERNNV